MSVTKLKYSKPAANWVKFKDGKKTYIPNDNRYVFVQLSSGLITMGQWKNKKWCPDDVTHWADIPVGVPIEPYYYEDDVDEEWEKSEREFKDAQRAYDEMKAELSKQIAKTNKMREEAILELEKLGKMI